MAPIPEENGTVFLFIGRIMKEKGIEELIRAAELIKREFGNSSVQVIGPMENLMKNRWKG